MNSNSNSNQPSGGGAAVWGSGGGYVTGEGGLSNLSSSGNFVAVSAAAASAHKPEVEELLLILKWGGVLTHAGRRQAENLGRTFRLVMYPR